MKLNYDVTYPKSKIFGSLELTRRMIEEFANSKRDSAEVMAFKDCYANIETANHAYRYALGKWKFAGEIAVMMRGGRLFLVRLGEKTISRQTWQEGEK